MKKLIVAALLGIITTTKAMTITDNLIVWECPYCGAKASERELGSWNTFGAVFWSDCFRIAPMAPSQDIVSRCWKCKKVFAKWQAKHKSILEEKVPREDRRRIKWIGDYSAVKEVLDAWKGKLKPELECELRMRMLWAANHKYRKATLDASNERLVEGLRIDGITVPEAQENMLKLSSSTNLPMWLRAEVLWEMGKFGAAQKMMDDFAKSNPGDFKEGEDYFKDVLERIKEKDVKVFKR